MRWQDDPVFIGNPEDDHMQVSKIATPAFRLSLQSGIHQLNPMNVSEPYAALFRLFEPILRRDCKRLLFIEGKSAKPRRRKSITEDDWTPFEALCTTNIHNEVRGMGFDFQSGHNGDPDYPRHDIGPTKFYVTVMNNVRLDASIPVADFEAGALDTEALKACLLELPVYSGTAGFGLCISDTFDWPVNTHELNAPARRFPVLDCCVSIERQWYSDMGQQPHVNTDFRYFWLGGINWITHVGEPFLSALGGVRAITDGLDSAITWATGKDTLVLQLGARPITGQAGVDDDLLPLYFELGQRLRPLGDGCPSEANNRQRPFTQGVYRMRENLLWARRFYDGPGNAWFQEFAEGKA